jgi:thioredoxin 1
MSANVISTDDRGFDRTVLQSPQPVLVDFWAPWCGPCRMVAPVVEELAGQYQGRLRAVKVNVDESPEVMSRYGIMSIPTLIFFRNGQEVHREIGALPKARLSAAVEQVLSATDTAATRA